MKTNEAVHQFPQYKCHKVVRAGVICSWHSHGLVSVEVRGTDTTIEVEVGADWIQKHKPQSGGYLVAYEDGYLSYSPAEAFEGGYSPFNPEAERILADNNRRAAMAIEAIMSKSEVQQGGGDADMPEDEGQEGFASFSAALTWLKEGRKVARSSWPDDKYVCLYTSQTTTHGGVVREQILKAHGANYGANFNGKWIATSEDLLATDWMVVTRYRSGI